MKCFPQRCVAPPWQRREVDEELAYQKLTPPTQFTLHLPSKWLVLLPSTLKGWKYLGIHLDRRLTCAKHIWQKRLQPGLIYRKIYWLMGRSSQLSLMNSVRGNKYVQLNLYGRTEYKSCDLSVTWISWKHDFNLSHWCWLVAPVSSTETDSNSN